MSEQTTLRRYRLTDKGRERLLEERPCIDCGHKTLVDWLSPNGRCPDCDDGSPIEREAE